MGEEIKMFCLHKDKVPFSRTDDKETFLTISEALSKLTPDTGLGIGFFGPLCGIDIDHAVDENGVIAQTALDIMDMFKGAYIEFSPSGTGIHILFACGAQHKRRKYYIKMNPTALQKNNITDIGGLEFYQGTIDNRYFTLTGNTISSSERSYTFSEKTVLSFLDKYMLQPSTPTTPTQSFSSSDEEDIAWFNWARKNKAQRLFELASKQPTGSGGTESEDDLLLLSELAFRCNKNVPLMISAFEHSSYYKNKDKAHKDKWAREDYRKRTIEKALQNPSVAKVYYSDYYHYDSIKKEVTSNDK